MNKKIIKQIILLIIFILIVSNVNVIFSASDPKGEWENWLKNNKTTLDAIAQKGYGATGDIINETTVIQKGISYFLRMSPDSSWDSTSIENAIKYGKILNDNFIKYGDVTIMFGDSAKRDAFDDSMKSLENIKNGVTSGSSGTSGNIPSDWINWPNCSPSDVAVFEYKEENLDVFKKVCELYMNPNPSSDNMSDDFAEKFIKDLNEIMNQVGMKEYLQREGEKYRDKLVAMMSSVAKSHNITEEEAKKALEDSGATITASGGNVDKEKEEEEKKSESIYNYPGQKETNSAGSLDDMIGDADKFIDSADDAAISTSSLKEFSKTFYNIFLTIGIVVATLVGSILGIKFMIGGAEEKAHVKELLVPYIVGCIVIFGAFAIWKIVVTILSNSLA